jgi:hypothetical protein
MKGLSNRSWLVIDVAFKQLSGFIQFKLGRIKLQQGLSQHLWRVDRGRWWLCYSLFPRVYLLLSGLSKICIGISYPHAPVGY